LAKLQLPKVGAFFETRCVHFSLRQRTANNVVIVYIGSIVDRLLTRMWTINVSMPIVNVTRSATVAVRSTGVTSARISDNPGNLIGN